jgi:hypothetical protein
MNINLEEAEKCIKELIHYEFIKYDYEAEVVLVNNFLKYNPLENINQVKGAAKVLSSIPKTNLFYELVNILKNGEIKQSENLVKALNNYIRHNGFEDFKILNENDLEEKKSETEVVETVENSDSTKENDDEKLKAENEKQIKTYKELYDEIFKIYPRKAHQEHGMTKFLELVKEGEYTPKTLYKCAKSYAKYVEKENIETKFIVKISNFFGEKKVFKDYVKKTSDSDDEVDRLFNKVNLKDVKVVNSSY